MIEDILKNLHLTPEEISIYISLLEKGTQSAAKLATNTSVKRTYVYKICEDLTGKGLITQDTKGKAVVFAATSPDFLLSLAEKEKEKAEQSTREIEGILNVLKQKYLAIEEKPIITYLEGVEGVKKAYQDLLKVKEPISALVQTSQVQKEVYDWLVSDFVKQRIDQQIPVRSIVTTGDKTQRYIDKNEKELRETRIVPSDRFPFEHEIDIYGNKVSIINNKRGEKLLAIIIENPLIAQTFRSWFEITWSELATPVSAVK